MLVKIYCDGQDHKNEDQTTCQHMHDLKNAERLYPRQDHSDTQNHKIKTVFMPLPMDQFGRTVGCCMFIKSPTYARSSVQYRIF